MRKEAVVGLEPVQGIVGGEEPTGQKWEGNRCWTSNPRYQSLRVHELELTKETA